VVNNGVLGEMGTGNGRPGTGLIGLRERLSAEGGCLETRHHGPRFVLTASLPRGVVR
jgi:glucose-6-phosphate-specific signal transduction histidine kinase